MEYSKKLKDPRWQKTRLKIFERDDWACRQCGDDKSTLHVHHRRYLKGREPWEYPDVGLVTLCEDCHIFETETMKESCQTLVDVFKVIFFSSDIQAIACDFQLMKPWNTSENMSAMIGWAAMTPYMTEYIEEKYVEYLLERKNGLKEKVG